ncbi:hypothetical protein DH2020_011014 [Rehmannia glutinosa]|uniref:Uncharacterized protein n=1 Tax=Rehmannia glutinosa TaxID=99300 RepID=A0ABR0XCX2_REHGL
MSTIRLMAMAIPNKAVNNHFIFDRKPSNLCFVSSIGAGTCLIRRYCFQCKALQTIDQIIPTTRRSGNYKPPLWDFDFIQSLSSEYKEERYLIRASELMVQVKLMLEGEMEVVQHLEFIDDLQKLGISYHFEDKIKHILNHIYHDCKNSERDLYSTALQFRLMRQHGFSISQDDEGNIGNIDDEHLSLLVHNALELPLHWRTQRPNARWFINTYERRQYMKPIVLELAKLDFNIVQATHQEELKHVSRWWKKTSLAEKLPFARDRLVECYFWTIGGFLFEPQYGYARIMATKVNALITVIDDMFDVYGTLEELQAFNNAIQRTYLQEAKWYSKGYTPTLEEYMSNAWISISAPVILSHAFFLVTNPIKKEVVQSLYKYHNIVQCSSMILRLANDLGTSPDEMERGDVPKSIQCYMNDTGVGREEAREYVRFLIYETWKKMNKERVADSPFQQNFVKCAVDLGRMAQYMYQHGDGHGIQYHEMKDRISSLLFEPIM